MTSAKRCFNEWCLDIPTAAEDAYRLREGESRAHTLEYCFVGPNLEEPMKKNVRFGDSVKYGAVVIGLIRDNGYACVDKITKQWADESQAF